MGEALALASHIRPVRNDHSKHRNFSSHLQLAHEKKRIQQEVQQIIWLYKNKRYQKLLGGTSPPCWYTWQMLRLELLQPLCVQLQRLHTLVPEVLASASSLSSPKKWSSSSPAPPLPPQARQWGTAMKIVEILIKTSLNGKVTWRSILVVSVWAEPRTPTYWGNGVTVGGAPGNHHDQCEDSQESKTNAHLSMGSCQVLRLHGTLCSWPRWCSSATSRWPARTW